MEAFRSWIQKYFIIISVLTGVGAYLLAYFTAIRLEGIAIAGTPPWWWVLFLPLAIYLVAVFFLVYILRTSIGIKSLVLIAAFFLGIGLVVAQIYLNYQKTIKEFREIGELESYLPSFASSTNFSPQSLCFSLKNWSPDVFPHEQWALELNGVITKPTFTDPVIKNRFDEVLKAKFGFEPFYVNLGEGEEDRFRFIDTGESVNRHRTDEAVEKITASLNFDIGKNLGIKDYGSLKILLGYQVVGTSAFQPIDVIASTYIPKKITDALQREQLGNFSKEERVCENLDKTANWKTYKNPKYGFKLQYPEEWHENEAKLRTADGFYFEKKEIPPSGDYALTLEKVLTVGDVLDLPALVRADYISIYGPSVVQDKSFILPDRMFSKSFGGLSTVRTHYRAKGGGIPSVETFILDANAHRVYQFSCWLADYSYKETGECDNILDTLSFSLDSKGDATSNWKTYRNERYGFEIGYPSNFVVQETNIDNPFNIIIKNQTETPEQTYEGPLYKDHFMVSIIDKTKPRNLTDNILESPDTYRPTLSDQNFDQRLTEFSLNGHTWKSYYYTGGIGTPQPPSYITEKNDILLEVIIDGPYEKVTKILKTIKFE